MVDMSTRAQGLAGRATRWPRKAVSDLVEVGWRGRSARLRHALYPEAVCHGPLVATVQDLVVYDPMFNEGRTRAYYRWRHDRAITSAARVICPSQATADDVQRIHPRTVVRVVHL